MGVRLSLSGLRALKEKRGLYAKNAAMWDPLLALDSC